jgi:hypothetical protein
MPMCLNPVLSLVGVLVLPADLITHYRHGIPATDSDVQRAIGASPSVGQRVS